MHQRGRRGQGNPACRQLPHFWTSPLAYPIDSCHLSLSMLLSKVREAQWDCIVSPVPRYRPSPCWPPRGPLTVPTSVKLLGEAAQRLTVVSGHSCSTSLVFSSTRITESLVIPSRRGTSLFLPFIFSWNSRYQGSVLFLWMHLVLPTNSCFCSFYLRSTHTYIVFQNKQDYWLQKSFISFNNFLKK